MISANSVLPPPTIAQSSLERLIGDATTAGRRPWTGQPRGGRCVKLRSICSPCSCQTVGFCIPAPVAGELWRENSVFSLLRSNVRAKRATTACRQVWAVENVRAPTAQAWWHAVGAPLERRVRAQRAALDLPMPRHRVGFGAGRVAQDLVLCFSENPSSAIRR
jgi:hypothetical protein